MVKQYEECVYYCSLLRAMEQLIITMGFGEHVYRARRM